MRPEEMKKIFGRLLTLANGDWYEDDSDCCLFCRWGTSHHRGNHTGDFMMLFPRSRIVDFHKERQLLPDSALPHYRKGQHFYHFMELHKVEEPESKELAEKLWNADSVTAQALINKHTDWSN